MNLASQKYMQLNPKWFKSFMAVCEYKQITSAADHSAQSPSVVSEHLKQIKDYLEKDVFIKVGDSYELTDTGRELRVYIKRIAEISQEFHDQVSGESHAMEGMVRYAMPHSCLQSPHFPMLLDRRKDFPELELTVELCPSPVVVDSILQGKFDFGFVTEKVNHPNLKYIEFCEEEYVFVSSEEIDPDTLTSKTLQENFNYIEYPGMDVCFDLFVRHHFPEDKKLSSKSLKHAGEINEIVGAIKMVIGGLGVSVFPRHVVEEYLNNGDLVEVSLGATPVNNLIYITRLKNVIPSSRVETVIQWFRDMHPEFQ